MGAQAFSVLQFYASRVIADGPEAQAAEVSLQAVKDYILKDRERTAALEENAQAPCLPSRSAIASRLSRKTATSQPQPQPLSGAQHQPHLAEPECKVSEETGTAISTLEAIKDIIEADQNVESCVARIVDGLRRCSDTLSDLEIEQRARLGDKEKGWRELTSLEAKLGPFLHLESPFLIAFQRDPTAALLDMLLLGKLEDFTKFLAALDAGSVQLETKIAQFEKQLDQETDVIVKRERRVGNENGNPTEQEDEREDENENEMQMEREDGYENEGTRNGTSDKYGKQGEESEEEIDERDVEETRDTYDNFRQSFCIQTGALLARTFDRIASGIEGQLTTLHAEAERACNARRNFKPHILAAAPRPPSSSAPQADRTTEPSADDASSIAEVSAGPWTDFSACDFLSEERHTFFPGRLLYINFKQNAKHIRPLIELLIEREAKTIFDCYRATLTQVTALYWRLRNRLIFDSFRLQASRIADGLIGSADLTATRPTRVLRNLLSFWQSVRLFEAEMFEAFFGPDFALLSSGRGSFSSGRGSFSLNDTSQNGPPSQASSAEMFMDSLAPTMLQILQNSVFALAPSLDTLLCLRACISLEFGSSLDGGPNVTSPYQLRGSGPTNSESQAALAKNGKNASADSDLRRAQQLVLAVTDASETMSTSAPQHAGQTSDDEWLRSQGLGEEGESAAVAHAADNLTSQSFTCWSQARRNEDNLIRSVLDLVEREIAVKLCAETNDFAHALRHSGLFQAIHQALLSPSNPNPNSAETQAAVQPAKTETTPPLSTCLTLLRNCQDSADLSGQQFLISLVMAKFFAALEPEANSVAPDGVCDDDARGDGARAWASEGEESEISSPVVQGAAHRLIGATHRLVGVTLLLALQRSSVFRFFQSLVLITPEELASSSSAARFLPVALPRQATHPHGSTHSRGATHPHGSMDGAIVVPPSHFAARVHFILDSLVSGLLDEVWNCISPHSPAARQSPAHNPSLDMFRKYIRAVGIVLGPMVKGDVKLDEGMEEGVRQRLQCIKTFGELLQMESGLFQEACCQALASRLSASQKTILDLLLSPVQERIAAAVSQSPEAGNVDAASLNLRLATLVVMELTGNC